MKKIAINTVLAFALSNTLALADNSNANATKLDINKALPKTITTIDNPVHPHVRKYTPIAYSPQQKAKIVGLELKSN